MTFNQWIKKQEDIWRLLEEQREDTREKRFKFFDSRIKCVLGIDKDSTQSYERMFQDNKDINKKIMKVPTKSTEEEKNKEKPTKSTEEEKNKEKPTKSTEEEKNEEKPTKSTEEEKNKEKPTKSTEEEKNEEKPTKSTEEEKNEEKSTESTEGKKKHKGGRKSFDEDIQFGDKEQLFFRKIFEMFPTSGELTLIENDKWEEFDIKDRIDLFDKAVDMLENNEYWIRDKCYIEWAWCGYIYESKEDELKERLFFPHMYRIRKKLRDLKEKIMYYSKSNKGNIKKREKQFEQDLDKYLAILNDRMSEETFVCRINKKINRIQQLRFGLSEEQTIIDKIIKEDGITEQDRCFEADLDSYLNWLEEYKNGKDYFKRIISKIECIEKMWSIYDVNVPKGEKSSKLREIGESGECQDKYHEMGIKMEMDSEEDEMFEQKLEKYIKSSFGKEKWKDDVEEELEKYARERKRRENQRLRNRRLRNLRLRKQRDVKQRHRNLRHRNLRHRNLRHKNQRHKNQRCRNQSYKRIDSK